MYFFISTQGYLGWTHTLTCSCESHNTDLEGRSREIKRDGNSFIRAQILLQRGWLIPWVEAEGRCLC